MSEILQDDLLAQWIREKAALLLTIRTQYLESQILKKKINDILDRAANTWLIPNVLKQFSIEEMGRGPLPEQGEVAVYVCIGGHAYIFEKYPAFADPAAGLEWLKRKHKPSGRLNSQHIANLVQLRSENSGVDIHILETEAYPEDKDETP